MFRLLARNWWVLALRGVAGILFGVLSFIWPGITLAALVLLFGVYAIADGVLALITAFRAAEHHDRWGPLVIEGIVGIAAGLIAFFWPEITALALLFVIAFWAILTGVLEIALAVRLRHDIQGEWLLGLSGVASLIFGLLLVIAPGAGALAVVWLIGTYAIVFGVLLLALAFRLRTLASSLGHAPVGGV